MQHPLIARLLKTPRHINPAVALCQELEAVTLLPEEIIARQKEIQAALVQGQAEMQVVETALKALRQCAPVPATRIPTGF